MPVDPDLSLMRQAVGSMASLPSWMGRVALALSRVWMR